jgi:lipopolysaccharide transport system ATP-binding protein
MADIALKVENLGKLYHIGARQEKYPTLRSALVSGIKSLTKRRLKSEAEKNILWALKDVSFEVKHGEVVGIIGRNGAGKSTLLKLLAHITEPTKGRVSLYGRVGSLLEVGTGFHPELTGRDNIYLNGAILGMKRTEIERKFDEIVAFSEIEKFLDTPVKRYSSGMYVRLAFAVAAHLEPDILLVDEVLAVGDAEFQKKCLGKMGDVAKGGRTILFVSHNMASIKQLCSKGILLQEGQISCINSINDVINEYQKNSSSSKTPNFIDLSKYKSDYGKNELEVFSIELINSTNGMFSISWDQPIRLKIRIHVNQKISSVSLGIGINTLEGLPLMTVRSTDKSSQDFDLTPGEHVIISEIFHNLRAGYFNLLLGIASGNYTYYFNPSVCGFEILDVGNTPYLFKNNGIVNVNSHWEVE